MEEIGFVVVCDPQRIFARGALFDRQAVAHTLWLACFPEGLVLRDLADNRRYEVEDWQRKLQQSEHQQLVALGRDVALRATGNNGCLKRVEGEML